MAKVYYSDSAVTLWLGDCREVLPTLEAGSVDLVLTDPPYGIGATFGKVTTGKWPTKHHNMPIVGDDRQFDPTPLLAFPDAILWGANFYADKLPPSGWLAWDKRRGVEDMSWDRSDMELAWCSGKKTVKTFRHLWHGLCRDSEIGEHWHPTQKPIALMVWCMSFFPHANSILDPFAGSGTTLRAAKDLGRKAIGIEIEERYCEIAAKRMEQSVLDFGPAPERHEPAELFPESTPCE